MSRFLTCLFSAAILFPSVTMAAVVATNNDMMVNAVLPTEGVFRTFFDSGTVGTEETATDGNNVLATTIAPNSGTFGSGYAWDLNVQDYADALGNPGGANKLQNGWVIRQSVWLAEDANDPLLNEGTWTDSLEFVLADSFGPGPAPQLLKTSAVNPSDFTPSNCDIGTGVCSTGTPFSSTTWTQVSHSYEIDDFDLSGPLDDVVNVRPVLFLGDFTSGEVKQGTMYSDNLVIEVFEDLASANATALPNNEPAGIPGSSAGVVGDYNGNGTVDAADYTMWRDGDSPDSTIAGYNLWVANFGNTSSTAISVPEPASLGLALLAGLALMKARRQRS